MSHFGSANGALSIDFASYWEEDAPDPYANLWLMWTVFCYVVEQNG